MSNDEWEEFLSELNYAATQMEPSQRYPLDVIWEILNDVYKKLRKHQALIEELFDK